MGYISAVYVGMIVLPALMVNFPGSAGVKSLCEKRIRAKLIEWEPTDHDKCDFEPEHGFVSLEKGCE